MSRWIDIDDISLLKTVSVGGLSAKALWRRIRQQPSIDIVRCKECRNLYIDTSDEGTSCYWCGVWANATDENGFCSHGKRKTEPQTSGLVWTEDAIKNEPKSYTTTTWASTDEPQTGRSEE